MSETHLRFFCAWTGNRGQSLDRSQHKHHSMKMKALERRFFKYCILQYSGTEAWTLDACSEFFRASGSDLGLPAQPRLFCLTMFHINIWDELRAAFFNVWKVWWITISSSSASELTISVAEELAKHRSTWTFRAWERNANHKALGNVSPPCHVTQVT